MQKKDYWYAVNRHKLALNSYGVTSLCTLSFCVTIYKHELGLDPMGVLWE